jgi:antiviral helicase SLH1
VNILLQAWISGSFIEDFALVSDSHYVAQNGGRIIRALLEIAISRKWSNASSVLMSLSKAIEKRMWPFDHPLKQFKSLKADVIYGLDNWAEDWQIPDLANTSAKELGDLIHLNESHGNALLRAARQFPALDISYSLRPLGSDVLKLVVRVQSAFTWNSDVHKSVEPFWLWIEDPEESSILQLANVVIRQATQVVNVDFVISIPNGRPPPSLTIRYVSDRWMGAEDELVVPLDMLTMPQVSQSHTPRLDLPFLSLTALSNPPLEKSLSRRMHGFNALQTQVFWSLMRTKMHSLVCAPAGSGKSTIMEALVW